MKAMNYTYEIEDKSLRAYAIPSSNEYQLSFTTKEEAPEGSRELFSKLPFNASYGVSSLIEGIIIEPLMTAHLDSCKLIKNENDFWDCEMIAPTLGTVSMHPVVGDFEDIENISLSSEQVYYLSRWLGYDKQREVNEWFEECKKRLCVKK